MDRIYVFKDETLINQPRSVVFNFFSEAVNLELLTPPWLRFRILSNLPITMSKGVQIKYRLQLYHIPLKWLTEISLWEPPFRFIDKQLKGPYKLWIHLHQFEDTDTGTRMIDELKYAIPPVPFRHFITHHFVANRINEIFSYRKKMILEYFS
jgi:ligand-binding SRPBCC domain-containing protein